MKHGFIKHALWTALFVAGGALAQDAAISGADFTSGNANAQLSAIGSQAAADNKTVVVTAPPYWQAKVAAKIRAGAHGKPVAIRFSNGFYENVLVRTEAAAPAQVAEIKPAAKPATKVAVAAKPAAKPKAVEPKPPIETKVVAEEPIPRQTTTTVTMPLIARASTNPSAQPRARAPAPNDTAKIETVPQVSHQPAVVPIPTTAIDSVGVKPALPQASRNTNDGTRQRMLAALNDGRPASGSLTEAQLQAGDQVYSEGDTLAAVRLEGLHRNLYWLQGSVDLQRVQFMPQGGGRYLVTGTIDPKAPVSHRADAHRVIAAVIPAAASATRTRLEQQYNSGQPIADQMSVGQLRPEDRLLVDGGTILVVRREGNSMARYWLDGSIDLGQSGVQKVDANVYRVTGDNLH